MDRSPVLMPWPAVAGIEERGLAVSRLRTGAKTDAGLARAVQSINALLGRGTGITLSIDFELVESRPVLPRLGEDESYCLEIASSGVVVAAQRHSGALRALSTLAQLAAGWGSLPIGRIEDRPKYPWRGLMLDVARRFVDIPALFGIIDAMAFYKLNVLHLHLSDDQGFRLRSGAYPRLASSESYSAAQLRQVVRRARERGIRVVPELDMPGHVTSWLVAYPQWGPPPNDSAAERNSGTAESVSQPPPLAQDRGSVVGKSGDGKEPEAFEDASGQPPRARASKRFGPHEAVLNVADEGTYQVIDTLFGELAEIFPDPYVHIGGDEVQPDGWMDSPEIRGYMARFGLADAVALQAHFNAKVAAIARSHGKRLIGWDEALNGGAPADMTIQAWRGATARDRAMAAGHACIDSSGYYLDLFYPADVHHAWDPSAPTAYRLAQEDALLEDPRLKHVAAGLRWTHAWRTAGAAPRTTADPQAVADPHGAAEPRPAMDSQMIADAHAATAAEVAKAIEFEPDRDVSDHPVPAGRNDDGPASVLGGEACLWGELVNERVLPVRLWSRMPVIAERLWSLDAPTENLGERLRASLDQLAAAGLADVRRTSRGLLLEFGVADAQIDAVELLEPVKWYGRLLGEVALQARIEGAEMPRARPYDMDTPLNRPVDALPPESFAAKRFARLLGEGARPSVGELSSLRRECERLLGVCRLAGYAAELQEPINRLGKVLRVVLDVLEGGLDISSARGRVAAAGEPAGEYIVAIAPPVLGWLNKP